MSESSSTSSSPRSQPCAVCGTSTTNQCSGCKSAHYCSRAHAKSAWLTHKETCGPPVGTKVKLRALLFPAREYRPKLVDIEYTVMKNPEAGGIIWHMIDLGPWMTPGAFPRSHPITQHNYDGPYLGRTLMMFFNDHFSFDQSPLNRTIASMVSDDFCWRDNILVVGAREPLHKYEQYYNATENDIAPTIQYLMGYGKKAKYIRSQYV